MALAGILRILVQGDTAQLQTDLQAAQRSAQQLGENMRHAFDSATGAIARFAGGMENLPTLLFGAGIGLAMQQVIRFADELDEAADRIGLTVEAFQVLRQQATEAGATAQQFERGIAKMNTTLGQAAAGNTKAMQTFVDLKVAWNDVSGATRTTEAVFRDVMQRLSEIPNPADRAAKAVELFGQKMGPALLSAFKDGVAGMDAFEQRAKELGLVLSQESVQNLSKLNDNLERTGTQFKVLAANMMEALGPVFDRILKFINDAITAWRGILNLMGIGAETATTAWTKVAVAQQHLADVQGHDPAIVKFWEDRVKVYTEAAQALDAVVQKQAEAEAAARRGPPAGAVGQTHAQELKAYYDKEIAPRDVGKQQAEAAAKMDKIREEQDALTKKFYEDQQKQEEAATALRVKNNYDAAQQELKDQTEAQAAENQMRKDEAEREQAEEERLRAARVARNFAAAQQELEDVEKANELRNAAILKGYEDAVKLAQDMTAPIQGVFNAIGSGLDDMVRGVLQGTQTIQDAFKRMGENIVLSIANDIIQRGLKALEKAFIEMVTQMLITRALSGAGGGVPLAAAAEGGIVTGPTVLLAGESGPEAIVPLDRLSDSGGGGVTVNVIDQRRSGNVEQRQSTGANGQPQVDVLITDVVSGGIKGGVFDQAFANTYGLTRRGVSR